jgi:uncharacterized membrane protein
MASLWKFFNKILLFQVGQYHTMLNVLIKEKKKIPKMSKISGILM